MKPYRWLVAMLVLAVAGVVGAQWLAQHDPSRLGQVIVRSGGWDYSTTVPRALLLLVLAWLAPGFLWSMLRLPFRAWSRYRKRQGRARLLEGLRALKAGHWQRAERLLAATAEDAQSGAIALAAAVRAADGRGDPAAAQRWLSALAPRDPPAPALDCRPSDAYRMADGVAGIRAALGDPGLQLAVEGFQLLLGALADQQLRQDGGVLFEDLALIGLERTVPEQVVGGDPADGGGAIP